MLAVVFRRPETHIGELILGNGKTLDSQKIAKKLESMMANHATVGTGYEEYVSKMSKEEHMSHRVEAEKTHYTAEASPSPEPDEEYDYREL